MVGYKHRCLFCFFCFLSLFSSKLMVMTGACIKRNKKHSDPCMDHTRLYRYASGHVLILPQAPVIAGERTISVNH